MADRCSWHIYAGTNLALPEGYPAAVFQSKGEDIPEIAGVDILTPRPCHGFHPLNEFCDIFMGLIICNICFTCAPSLPNFGVGLYEDHGVELELFDNFCNFFMIFC